MGGDSRKSGSRKSLPESSTSTSSSAATSSSEDQVKSSSKLCKRRRLRDEERKSKGPGQMMRGGGRTAKEEKGRSINGIRRRKEDFSWMRAVPGPIPSWRIRRMSLSIYWRNFLLFPGIWNSFCYDRPRTSC